MSNRLIGPKIYATIALLIGASSVLPILELTSMPLHIIGPPLSLVASICAYRTSRNAGSSTERRLALVALIFAAVLVGALLLYVGLMMVMGVR